MRVAKNYYNDKLDKSKSNLKILNEVLNRRIFKTPYPANFTTCNIVVKISNHADIAKSFCDYFTNIGPNLSSKISFTNS